LFNGHFFKLLIGGQAMTKKILDLSISFLVVTFAITIWFGIFTAKIAAEKYIVYLEEQMKTQEEIIAKGKELQEIVTEASIAFGVIALSEQNIIPPSEAEKMISESLGKSEKKSERLGTIAKYLNDYRIKQQRRR
jgi:hypothetical protein